MKKKNIYPILEHIQWQKKDSFNIPLYRVEKMGVEFPLISFVQGDNNGYRIIESTEEIGLTGGELVRASFQNLAKFEVQWVSQKINEATPILYAQATWAAEKILDTAFLIQASQLLGTTRLLVAIPMRGLILATPYTPSDTHMAFRTYVSDCYENMSGLPLSDNLYIIENGKIKGLSMVKPLKPTLEHDHNGSVFVKVKKDISIKILKRADAQGLESYAITLGAEDFDDFANASYQIIIDILNKNEDNPNFNGLLEFSILTSWLPQSADFENTLSNFMERLKMQSKLTAAANTLRKDIAITFVRLSDTESGKPHIKHKLKIFSTI
jgi:hypothetical protein